MSNDLDISDNVAEAEYPSEEELSDKSKIHSMSNEELCELIVSFQYLGCFEDNAIAAMHELSNRRELGEVFDFESEIREKIAELPKLDLNIVTPFKSFLP